MVALRAGAHSGDSEHRLRGCRDMARLTRMLHEGGVIPPARSSAPGATPIPSAAAVLVRDSISPNTRRAYTGALARLDAWLDGRVLADHTPANAWSCIPSLRIAVRVERPLHATSG